jgi:hypothetical protein
MPTALLHEKRCFPATVLLAKQVEFLLPDGLQIEIFRAGVVELGEPGHVMGVTSLCGGREPRSCMSPINRCLSGVIGVL